MSERKIWRVTGPAQIRDDSNSVIQTIGFGVGGDSGPLPVDVEYGGAGGGWAAVNGAWGAVRGPAPVQRNNRKVKPAAAMLIDAYKKRKGNISYDKIADLAGIPKATLFRVKAGRGLCHESTYRCLAELLGCEPQDLLPDVDQS